MPFLKKPVAFDSINFLPGFPSLSAYSCNPWDTSTVTPGACKSTPVQIARQLTNMPASVAIQRAMMEAGAAPPKFNNMLRRGVVPAGMAGIVRQLRGIGGGGGGSTGDGGDALGGIGYGGDGGSIGDGYRVTRLAGLGGCGCGGSCGGCGGDDHSHGGLGFALTDITSDPVGWVTANAVPLLIGAGLVWFLKRK